ncbi:uncharacterized protein DS421_3g98960 [Arachis hypogaea]|nr:uncharacterized protein DS421_3g98960 [Arachis hypogaea]
MKYNTDVQRTSRTSMAFSFNFLYSAFLHSMTFSYKPHCFPFSMRLKTDKTKQKNYKMKNIEGEELLLAWVAMRTLCFHSFLLASSPGCSPLFIEGEASKVETIEPSQLLLLHAKTGSSRERREKTECYNQNAITSVSFLLTKLYQSGPFILTCSPRRIPSP